MTERISLSTSDGETLEARWDSPDEPAGAAVLCHPHPLHGGSMAAPLMIAVSGRLVERGLAVLRFNFRGTGSSTGEHDHGIAELKDIDAAFEHARARFGDVVIGGWSFGAATALAWVAQRSAGFPYVGIAPPPDRLPESLPDGPKRIIAGTRDQVVDVHALRVYAASRSIDLVLTPGDHFFHGRGKKIGDLVAQGFGR